MFAAAQSSGRVLAEAFMYRHHTKLLKLKELVDDGSIGQPLLYHSAERVFQIDSSFQVPFRSQAEVVGTEGVITRVRPFQPSTPETSLTLRRGDREETLELPNPPIHWLEIEDMPTAILTGAARDAGRNARACGYAAAALRRGQPLGLTLPVWPSRLGR